MKQYPLFVWGAIVSRRELPRWLELVNAYFPASPELARETRERLLDEGREWLGRSRRG